MATLNAVILPAKVLKGGRHKVRISVAHNGEVRYINTNIVLDDKSEFKNGSVRKRPDSQYLNTKIRTLLNKYTRTLDEIGYIDGLTCSELVLLLKNDGAIRNKTYRQVMDELTGFKPMSRSTLNLYRLSVNLLEQEVGDLPIANINHALILKLVTRMREKHGIMDSTVQQYINKLRALLNYATKCGYVKLERNPFVGLELQASKPRDCWLTLDQIRAIRDLNSHRASLNFYRDIFMLSFYFGGINAVDLFQLDLSGDKICYVRTKTRRLLGSEVEFGIPKEAMPIIKRLIGKDGRIRYPGRSKLLTNAVCGWMKTLGKAIGVDDMVYYAARKSFAQQAYGLGVKESVIDYILGHSVEKSMGRAKTRLYPYVVVTPQMATDAIRCVLDKLAEK